MCHASRCRISNRTKWALDRLAAVGARVEVHFDVVVIVKKAVAFSAEKVFSDLVVLDVIMGRRGKVAVLQRTPFHLRLAILLVEVAKIPHMLQTGTFASEVPVAGVALEIRPIVARRAAMVVPSVRSSRKLFPTGSALKHVESCNEERALGLTEETA